MKKLNPRTVKPGDYLFVKGEGSTSDYVVLVKEIEILKDIIGIYDECIFRRPGTYDPRWKKSHYDEPIDMLKSTFTERVSKANSEILEEFGITN